jgi:hypothetical protein
MVTETCTQFYFQPKYDLLKLHPGAFNFFPRLDDRAHEFHSGAQSENKMTISSYIS